MSLEALTKVIEELEPKSVSDDVFASLKLMRSLPVFESIYPLLDQRILDVEIVIRELELEIEKQRAELHAMRKKNKKMDSTPESLHDEDEEPDDKTPPAPSRRDK